jgi:hypothetical protein
MSQELPELTSLKILIIDDHELVLGGTLDVLRRQYPNVEILTSQNARDAREQVEKFLPNLIVMDLSIPEKSGTSARTISASGVICYLLSLWFCLRQDLRKILVEPPFVGAIHESPLLYMVFLRKSCENKQRTTNNKFDCQKKSGSSLCNVALQAKSNRKLPFGV